MPNALMIQGTTSDAGKSAMVTGLCRALSRRGVSVAPFKPQNMALNSAVTCDEGEIGRAQAVQAQACGLEPHTDMNPILLKPNTDTGAQVIIHGRALDVMDACTYHQFKPHAMTFVLESFHRLQHRYDVVIVEGAGSPAEINLRDNDIANMGFAEAVNCPVLLVADIERGGVFAQLFGTLALLSESEKQRVGGLIINRFRGDPMLLQSGVDWLEESTTKPMLGVVPYLDGLHLDAEDSLSTLAGNALHALQDKKINVLVPALPRMSNHTDLDPLRYHPQINLQIIHSNATIPAADLIILPGSKSVRADLAWLTNHGWRDAIRRHLRYGGKLIGLCGGFQMLGRHIADPHGVEGTAGECEGLGYLDIETLITEKKQLRNVSGRLSLNEAAVKGYEIHAGVSTGIGLQYPAVHLDQGDDGAMSTDGQVLGTYLHGLFESPAALTALLTWAGLVEPETLDYAALRETGIERLANAVETYLDMERVMSLIGMASARGLSYGNTPS